MARKDGLCMVYLFIPDLALRDSFHNKLWIWGSLVYGKNANILSYKWMKC